MRMTTTDHLLIERDLELTSRRGDTAMATERTRSVGWFFAQQCKAAWRIHHVKRRSATRARSNRPTPSEILCTSCTPKGDTQNVRGVMAAVAQNLPLLGPLFCATAGGRTFPVKVAVDASSPSPMGFRSA